jgi:selenocysteine-specific translation elongation factor
MQSQRHNEKDKSALQAIAGQRIALPNLNGRAEEQIM